MMRRTQPALAPLRAAFPEAKFFHLDRGDIDLILETLNRGPNDFYAEPLIRLFLTLKECGGNLRKMMNEDPELEKVVRKVCTTLWVPSANRRANLVLQGVKSEIERSEPIPGQPVMRPDRYAALLFHVGSLNAEWDKLAGPCERCGRYYLKSRSSQNVYCSRECGNRSTAQKRTLERITNERQDKMNRAKAAIKEWKRAKPDQDWKHWVSQKTNIDLRFLTRRFTETGGVKPTNKEGMQ